jgi:haloalkane dehalogenase
MNKFNNIRPNRTLQILDSFIATVDIPPSTKTGGAATTTTTIIFLHGNPTSSFLWRNILARITSNPSNNDLRLIAPDLLGHGKSGSHSPNKYPSFVSHYRYLDTFLNQILAPDEKVFFVLHDWGSALGFHWIAQQHHINTLAASSAKRILGLVHMESIVSVFEGWDEFPSSGRKVFQLFRESPGVGEDMILQKNFFLERLYKGEKKDWTPEEEAIVGERFTTSKDREVMLAWPREIPIRGTKVVGKPPTNNNNTIFSDDTIPIVDTYSKFLQESGHLPKLFINSKPGFFSPLIVEKTKDWKNHQIVGPVKGIHFCQETSPNEIADLAMEFIRKIITPQSSKL